MSHDFPPFLGRGRKGSPNMNTNLNQDRIDDLFMQAVSLPVADRQAFLASACDGDAGLLAEVQNLLAGHDRAEQSTDFLASTPPDAPARDEADEHSSDPLIGKHIGPSEVK